MLRDTLKDKEYFLEYIAEEEGRINKFETKLRNNEVREDRILNVRKKVYDLEYQILIAKHSMGEPIESLIDDYKLIAGKMEEFWDINLYEDMLWMLSIGIMLEIDKNTFDILAKLVEKHKVNDFLYNFIIHYRNEEVNYQNGNWLFEKPFKSLINVILCNDNTKSCEFMKKYLLEQWYVGHNDMGWYECHKHQEKLYFGYWSFESGAIAKILKLDDSSLKNTLYYPYDMVHYQEK
ncbi:DUF1911 domain-containing protein [Bacillus wiedmannii]|uniref:PoNe immunity protein domain-containing protein n=1 Tax=Bacillus wiedmannii TaxID=1890302 RepID=UPI002E2074BC|nr:DUF1911 domain-containing protein [Bacillus wiedmannii]